MKNFVKSWRKLCFAVIAVCIVGSTQAARGPRSGHNEDKLTQTKIKILLEEQSRGIVSSLHLPYKKDYRVKIRPSEHDSLWMLHIEGQCRKVRKDKSIRWKTIFGKTYYPKAATYLHYTVTKFVDTRQGNKLTKITLYKAIYAVARQIECYKTWKLKKAKDPKNHSIFIIPYQF